MSSQLSEIAARLNLVHGALLATHKGLLDYERERYEATHGSMGVPADVLQLVIHDPWFAWLQPLTALITQIDEFVSSKEEAEVGVGEALLAETRKLMRPGEGVFGENYLRVIQDSAEVAWMQGELRRAMG